MKKYFITILVCILISCSSPKKITDNFYSEDKNVNLFAFIGKKIFVNEFDTNLNNKTYRKEIDEETGDSILVTLTNHSLDKGFRCKYKIVKQVFNSIENDTVEFVAYDHYGRPEFEKSEFILLYISKNKEGNYFHQKYQFDDLKLDDKNIFYGNIFKLKNGKWFKQKDKASIEELFKTKKNSVFKELFK